MTTWIHQTTDVNRIYATSSASVSSTHGGAVLHGHRDVVGGTQQGSTGTTVSVPQGDCRKSCSAERVMGKMWESPPPPVTHQPAVSVLSSGQCGDRVYCKGVCSKV